jgi:hypothetical protein
MTNFNNAAGQNAIVFPSVTSGNTVDFVMNGTVAIAANATRIFRVYKTNDQVPGDEVIKVTIVTGSSGAAGVWSGTLTINNLASDTCAWAGSVAGNTIGTTGQSCTVNTFLAQNLSPGASQSFTVQWDTSDAAATKTFSLTFPAQPSAYKTWQDAVSANAGINTVNGAAVNFASFGY